MGANWIRNGVGVGTLRQADGTVRDVAERWDQFVEYLCLGLGQDRRRDIRPVRPRKQTTVMRQDADARMLEEVGVLQPRSASQMPPGTFWFVANLRRARALGP